MKGDQMKKEDWLAKSFHESGAHLRAVAYRMLGSSAEADDALQEAWLRLNRADSERIENLRGWLTTVVSRVCLDMLRARKSKKEEELERADDPSRDVGESKTPETDVVLADAVGPALLVILETLSPMERIAFVLHDLFDVSFKEIASIIDGTEASAKQLASRARRRVRGEKEASAVEPTREKEIVVAFLQASRDGDFSALLKVLAPDVILRADETAVKVAVANRAKGAPPFESEIRGAKEVADIFKGRATAAQLAIINGHMGATWAPGGNPVVAFLFTIENERIVTMDVLMDPERLKKTDVKIIDEKGGAIL
jgi:RNA polymerase sigma-70 factor (ECF subfamily)